MKPVKAPIPCCAGGPLPKAAACMPVDHDFCVEIGKNYVIRKARPTGGRAGKHRNVTSSIQVWYKGQLVVKQVRYKVGLGEDRMNAIEKAVRYAMDRTDMTPDQRKKILFHFGLSG